MRKKYADWELGCDRTGMCKKLFVPVQSHRKIHAVENKANYANLCDE